MSSTKPSIYIVGAGPGVGSSVAALFVNAGFDVGLIARSSSTLQKAEATLLEAFQSSPAPETSSTKLKLKVFTATADGANPDSMTTALDSLKQQFGPNYAGPTVVLYNVASVSPPGSELGPRPLESLTTEVVQKHFTISTVSAFVVAQWAASNIDVASGHKPMLFFTGGGLALAPNPALAALSMTKAALRNLNLSFHAALKPKGIHVATVTICGVLKPENEKYNPTLVADEFWKLYEQKREDVERWSAETIF